MTLSPCLLPTVCLSVPLARCVSTTDGGIGIRWYHAGIAAIFLSFTTKGGGWGKDSGGEERKTWRDKGKDKDEVGKGKVVDTREEVLGSTVKVMMKKWRVEGREQGCSEDDDKGKNIERRRTQIRRLLGPRVAHLQVLWAALEFLWFCSSGSDLTRVTCEKYLWPFTNAVTEPGPKSIPDLS